VLALLSRPSGRTFESCCFAASGGLPPRHHDASEQRPGSSCPSSRWGVKALHIRSGRAPHIIDLPRSTPKEVVFVSSDATKRLRPPRSKRPIRPSRPEECDEMVVDAVGRLYLQGVAGQERLGVDEVGREVRHGAA
jgi:hypothetical protein